MATTQHLPAERVALLPAGRDQLYVREVGEGRPIIALHGGPDFDHQYLVPELDRLATAFRVVYYDQRGRGRSYSPGSEQGVTIATETEDLDRVRQWIGAERVALLGHSWGGVLAMEYAIRRPARVSHLVLLNTAPASRAGAVALRQELGRRRSATEMARLTALLSDPGYVRGDLEADAEYYRIHFAGALRRSADRERLLARLRLGFTSEGIVAARAIEHGLYDETLDRDDYDLTPALRRLAVPTLVIHGADDLIPVPIARDIARAIPGSKLVILRACGHFAYLEQARRVAALVCRFLGARGAPGGA